MSKQITYSTTENAVAASTWYQISPKMTTTGLRRVLLINVGVNDDKITDHLLEINLQNGTFSAGASYVLPKVGDSHELYIDDSVLISYKSDTILGSIFILEQKAIPLLDYMPGSPGFPGAWAQTWTSYREDIKTGTIVQPVTSNTYQYRASNDGETGDTEPAWGLVVGGSTVDTFTNWAAATGYTLDEKVTPTVPNTYQYVCTTAGTTGALEPAWNTTIGGTTADGTAVWTTEALNPITWTCETLGTYVSDYKI